MIIGLWFIISLMLFFLAIFIETELTGLDSNIRPLLAFVGFALWIVFSGFAFAEWRSNKRANSAKAEDERFELDVEQSINRMMAGGRRRAARRRMF